MEKTFGFCWVRVSSCSKFNIEKYVAYDIPEPLELEGSGLQYVYAVYKDEAPSIVEKILSDGHEAHFTNGHVSCPSDNPQSYQVSMSYTGDQMYFLEELL